MPSPGRKLREAWAKGTLQVPGVFCPLVGRLAERLGFEAMYLSGAALSASKGIPDIGLVSVTEFADAAREITAASALPLLCDADTGFGEPLNVERTVRLFERAGVAGIHLEDQVLPKRCGHLSGKTLVEPKEMVAKIEAAVAARQDADFVIMARTDARGVSGMTDALDRAGAYLDAGADAIFPEALHGPEEFATFARELNSRRPALAPVPLLANMTEFGKSPLMNVAQLGELGYRLVLYPVSTLRLAMRAARTFLETIRSEGTQEGMLDDMLTRAELYDLLDYSGFEDRDRDYFG